MLPFLLLQGLNAPPPPPPLTRNKGKAREKKMEKLFENFRERGKECRKFPLCVVLCVQQGSLIFFSFYLLPPIVVPLFLDGTTSNCIQFWWLWWWCLRIKERNKRLRKVFFVLLNSVEEEQILSQFSTSIVSGWRKYAECLNAAAMPHCCYVVGGWR